MLLINKYLLINFIGKIIPSILIYNDPIYDIFFVIRYYE